MRDFVYGILFGFLLMFLCAFPVVGFAQGLPDSSVAYADSVAVRYEKTLTEQGYEPDGQEFAIQVSIALRYRFLNKEQIDLPVQVMAIKNGDPVALMVSGSKTKRDEVGSTSAPMSSATASDDEGTKRRIARPDRVSLKIGAYLSSHGYTGVYEAINDQADRYLSENGKDGDAGKILIPIKVIKNGRVMTIRISEQQIESGSMETSQLVNTAIPKKRLVSARRCERTIAFTAKARAANTRNHRVIGAKVVLAKAVPSRIAGVKMRALCPISYRTNESESTKCFEIPAWFGYLGYQNCEQRYPLALTVSRNRSLVGVRNHKSERGIVGVKGVNRNYSGSTTRLSRLEVLRN
ncbi:MAG TPA: hypothetical protein VN420_03300 [Candidatus Fimivivens sp.]|nr:hypothetical protein [Candidatus Fimivivens sp.]